MINATQLRKGMTIKLEDNLYRILEIQHLTPGNKHGMIITKLRNLRDGTQMEYKFRSKDRVERPYLEKFEMEYLYQKDDTYFFVNTETWEELYIEKEVLGEAIYYLVPNVKFSVEMFDGKPVGIEPPRTIDLKVVSTEPYLKGATQASNNKPAILETGLVVTVPFFIEEGDVVRIDTDENKYIERV
ncbi:MAG: elongation factor P [Candidatus Aminicenantia bacterium]